MMKFGASVPLWRREKYIGPFLDQMLRFNIEPVVVMSEMPFVNEGSQEPKEPDRSEWVVKTYFPEVKMIKGYFGHHRDSMMAGINELQHCDAIFINDCDIFLTADDWGKCFKYIEDNPDENIYRFDFETICTEYYYGYEYGKDSLKGGVPPIMAVKPGVRVMSMTHCIDAGYGITWDDPSVMIHHFRFCRGKYRPDDPMYCEPPQDKENCKPAPDEIIEYFKKWQAISKDLAL